MEKQDEKSLNTTRRKKRALTFVFPENAGPRMLPIIEIAKKEQISIQELCERSNMTRQGLYLKLANDDCRLSDFEKLAKGMGYEVKITLKRKYTKKTKPENE